MTRRRIIVAFEEIETPQDRMWRTVASGITEVSSKPVRLKKFWCAADKPNTDPTFMVAPVYRTSTVPEDAACETCGLEIVELQKLMTF